MIGRNLLRSLPASILIIIKNLRAISTLGITPLSEQSINLIVILQYEQ